MKKFFNILLSDSNKYSIKRFIGLICLIMFIAYGIVGLIKPFNVNFWIFYVTACNITIWVAFKFMSAEKILKYNVIENMSKFTPITDIANQFSKNEHLLDGQIQPDSLSGTTQTHDNLPME